ncbi:hypothetical protein ACR79B_11140 [Sphingobacterium spiritivorum]|uniref:hypothetical protein n=1 Tax=Sphingobacterium spiritivorum TaxID=258 RepID=UPI003DA3BD24
MNTLKKILKINSNGELVQFNERLRRWESTSMPWGWDDIHPDYLDESKENYDRHNIDND